MTVRGKYPNNTPLSEWLEGWLIFEVASIHAGWAKTAHQQDEAARYIMRSEQERAGRKEPASRQERIEFIRKHRPDAGLQCT